jgi:hypothetical protein
MSSKKHKIIYDGFTNKHKRKIVDHLSDMYQWEPVFMTGNVDDEVLKWGKAKYGECIIQDSMALRQAQFDYSKIGKRIPIDAEIINTLSTYGLNYLGFLPDTTGHNYSFTERKLFYYDMLTYWNTVINYLKPDMFVAFTRPHTPPELALYLLCKHYYEIDILFIDPFPLFNRHYHLIGTSIHDLSQPFVDVYKNNIDIEASPEVFGYLSELRSTKGITPEYIKETYKRDKNNKLVNIKKLLKNLTKTIIYGDDHKLGFHDWKINKRPYDSLDSRMNAFQYQIFLHLLAIKNIKLKRIYKSFCHQVNMDEKYLYFPASYQPEAATSINGGPYEEIFVVLDMLSASIPDDWLIYYKEHPAIFMKFGKGSLTRNNHFYEKIRSYRNIRIVPTEMDVSLLIDNSQSVASMAGSCVWEAIVRGTPAMSFGNAWFSSCKSIFNIYSLQDVRNAINQILDGYIPDEKDIERYAASIEKVAVKGMVHRRFIDAIEKCDEPEHELVRIAEAIYDAYKRNYLNEGKENQQQQH